MAYRTEIEKLEQRYAENPKQWFAALADAYRKQGDVDLAIEYVQGGIKDRPDYASAHIVLGRCYLDKEMDDDAARAFEQVLDLDAENIIALKSLEEIAERKGDVGGARQWLTRLLEVDPMNDEAHESLARLEAEDEAKAPTPEPPDLAVSEDAVDVSAVEVEPEKLDATMPMDDPQTVFGPLEIETAESDVTSLLAEVSEQGEPPVSEDETPIAIEPFEIETEDSDATSLLAAMPEGPELLVEEEEPMAILEPIELDTPAADASSLFADVPEEAEAFGALEDTAAEIEPIELDTADVIDMDVIDEEAAQRLSVPPTTEVESVNLEAMRAADEMVATSALDAAEAEEEEDEEAAEVAEVAEAEVEEVLEDVGMWIDEPTEGLLEDVPHTTEIDAVELEKLRVADALVAGSTMEALLPDGVEEEAESDDVLPLILPDEVGGAESAPDAEPEPVVTETMAEVYARQGLLEQACEIYEVLVMQHADDSRLKGRLDELNEQANTAIQETRQSRFSVAATGGESTVTYLQRIFAYEGEVGAEVHATDVVTEAPPEPESAEEPTPLEEAFADDPPEAPGDPTVVAADDVNLASVFDGGVPEPTTTEQLDGSDRAPEEQGNENGVSFDEFYGSEPGLSPETNGSPSEETPSDNDDDFKDWLKGLKT